MSQTSKKPRSEKLPSATAGKSARKFLNDLSGKGVVLSHIQGFRSRRPAHTPPVMNAAQIIQAVQEGLPISELTELQTSLAVPAEKLASMLGVSKATFHRRKGAGERLGTAESERVVRFARLLGKAIGVFGDEEDARLWLNSPQRGLGGALPLEYAKTEVGAREVENLLGRIEHGVYS